MRDGENKTKKCNDKTYEQKGPMHPTRNRFKKNTIMVDDGHGDSTLVAFTAGAEISDNTFEANELYGGNAKPGEIPQEAIVRGSKRPEEIKKMPDVDPAALKAVLGATAAPS
jgi:hypothetical protein